MNQIFLENRMIKNGQKLRLMIKTLDISKEESKNQRIS